ncbi:hypothetical protein [Candidatus Protochlamydia phocaeensis]|uniref:hypothetical protein n=1 Tax=Candidatus Protochlamydia phocaeensis TaxID=1414722 RepID=UPI0008392C77|nr:hypothetical protein [Candidatus Protochlamydia phocaeensis]
MKGFKLSGFQGNISSNCSALKRLKNKKLLIIKQLKVNLLKLIKRKKEEGRRKKIGCKMDFIQLRRFLKPYENSFKGTFLERIIRLALKNFGS